MLARLERPLFILLAVLAVALLVFLGLVLSGRIVEEEEQSGSSRKGPPPPPATTAATPRGTVAATTTATRTASRPARRASGTSTLLVAASRGDCWLEVRRGAATGETLYSGILTQGDSVEVRGKRFWIRFGAAANVDVTIGGSRAVVPAGTADVVVARTSRGARVLAG
jgi:hypothetical protein